MLGKGHGGLYKAVTKEKRRKRKAKILVITILGKIQRIKTSTNCHRRKRLGIDRKTFHAGEKEPGTKRNRIPSKIRRLEISLSLRQTWSRILLPGSSKSFHLRNIVVFLHHSSLHFSPLRFTDSRRSFSTSSDKKIVL